MSKCKHCDNEGDMMCTTEVKSRINPILLCIDCWQKEREKRKQIDKEYWEKQEKRRLKRKRERNL